jgi:hypothetical protein
VRYPLVEAGTGAAFAVVTAALLTAGLAAAIPAYLLLAAAVITLGLIVLDGHPPPRVLVVSAHVAAAVLLAGATVGTHEWWRPVWTLAGVLVAVLGTAPWRATARVVPVAVLVGAALGWLI